MVEDVYNSSEAVCPSCNSPWIHEIHSQCVSFWYQYGTLLHHPSFSELTGEVAYDVRYACSSPWHVCLYASVCAYSHWTIPSALAIALQEMWKME